MLPYYINSTSNLTFQHAEDRLNKLERQIGCKQYAFGFSVVSGDVLYLVDTDERLSIESLKVKVRRVHSVEFERNNQISYKDVDQVVICHESNIDTEEYYLDFYRVFTNEKKAHDFLAELVSARYQNHEIE